MHAHSSERQRSVPDVSLLLQPPILPSVRNRVPQRKTHGGPRKRAGRRDYYGFRAPNAFVGYQAAVELGDALHDFFFDCMGLVFAQLGIRRGLDEENDVGLEMSDDYGLFAVPHDVGT